MIFVIFSNLLSILVTDRRNRIFQQENSKIRNSWALCYIDVNWIVYTKAEYKFSYTYVCPIVILIHS